MIPDDFDENGMWIQPQVDLLINKNNFMIGHSWRTVLGLAVLFLIGGLQELHGVGGIAPWVDMAVPVLLALEHAAFGNVQ